MRFTELRLSGALLIEPDRRADERGWFARTWCREEFARRGLPDAWAQCSAAFNRRRGTLRGLHYQADPFPEAKLVRCTHGAVYDVIVDLRPDAPTFAQWVAVELSGENGRQLFVPPGFAHGYQTLTDGAELDYLISEAYRPELARGVRWDDPALAIAWPDCPERIVSERDRSFPDLRPAHSA
jgi:dTDP-4-dehydrorhamnose 3,5-epimerase